MDDKESVEVWGYYDTTPDWLPLQVDANGKVIVVTE